MMLRAAVLLLLAAAPASAAPGDLDVSFGQQGIALSAVGDEGAVAMTLANGKILTATVGDAGGDRASLRITRLTTSGIIDSSFGSAGVASVALPVDTMSVVRAMLRQASDNRIVVGGRSIDAFAVTRLTAAAGLDTGFGSGGTARTTIHGDDEIFALAEQDNGRIVAAGKADDGRDTDFAVVRYTTAGLPDPAFSGDGIATVDFGGDDTARSVAVHTDGTIAVAGFSEGSGSDIAVARLTSGGAPDPSFGSGGRVTTSVTVRDDAAYAVIVQPDGKIVVAGKADDDFVLVRYTTGGQLDPAFGSGGIARTHPAAGSSDGARALVRQSDGKLIAGGQVNPVRAGDLAVVRYTSGGIPDTTFGAGGIVTTSVAATFDEELTSLLLQGDGKLLASGLSEDGSTTYQIVARYLTASAASCGNGTVDNGEQCDDGNTSSGDGCSASCEIDAICGDADGNGAIQATDALRVLKAAVGQAVACPMLACDVDTSGSVQASDALRVLRKAVGQAVVLACPSQPG